jgi:replicative DNA helicase
MLRFRPAHDTANEHSVAQPLHPIPPPFTGDVPDHVLYDDPGDSYAYGSRRDAGRVPPQNLEAERTLLGAMLLSPDAIGVAVEAVKSDDFYKPLHGRVFDAIVNLYGKGEPVDSVTLADALRTEGTLDELGGLSFLRSLTADVPSVSNASYYARIVGQNSLLRRLISVSGDISSLAFDPGNDAREVLEFAEASVFAVGQERIASNFTVVGDLLDDEMQRLEHLGKTGEEVLGIATGFADFDKLTAGLQPSNLVIVAARPGMGKSTFMTNVAANVAVDQGRTVAFFTLEMSKQEVVQRLVCAEARVNASKIKTGKLSESDWGKVSRGVSILSEAPLHIDDSGYTTILDIRTKCRRLAAQSPDGLGLVIIDYLQLMHSTGRSESRQVEIAEISRGLKVLARELECPIIVASQLNRSPEARGDKRPLLGDLRESGSIEQDADIVLFLYRDDYYNGTSSETPGEAELIVAKHRNGPTDTINLAFLEHVSRFENLTRADESYV